jgi:hypothetical protein
MPLARTFARYALAVLALLLVAGACAGAARTPSPTPTEAPAGPLLTVIARGGLCPPGACETTVFVERDGRVHQAAKPPNELGKVPAEVLAALDEAMRSTDFEQVRSRPFTGMCPTAYDGQELVFEFGAPSGTERIESCMVAIDWSSPLFVAVRAAVAPFVNLPR